MEATTKNRPACPHLRPYRSEHDPTQTHIDVTLHDWDSMERRGYRLCVDCARKLEGVVAGMGKTIEELIEASSLGTPEAKALREQTPPEVVQKITDRVDVLRIDRLYRLAHKPLEAAGATASDVILVGAHLAACSAAIAGVSLEAVQEYVRVTYNEARRRLSP